MTALDTEIARRRTFAIISHPDAGKTTLTEKLLWFGGAIQVAGEVRARKASRHATSDWMELEKQRGISVTSSVMQFPYRECMINLLDTPGHEDFGRHLPHADRRRLGGHGHRLGQRRRSADIKVAQVLPHARHAILTFINKLDREGQGAGSTCSTEIESVLGIQCAPKTWPIGMGKRFRGVYHLYDAPSPSSIRRPRRHGRDHPGPRQPAPGRADRQPGRELRTDIETGAWPSHAFDAEAL